MLVRRIEQNEIATALDIVWTVFMHIGRKLFEVALKNSTANEITVNSSPYAVEVYHHLGFIDSATEETTNGIRYTPMTYAKWA